MPKAEILTIGTELLLGEIVDTNSRFIARALRDHGVDIYWLSTVGDNPKRIATALQQGMQRSEIIITTGGLGPTVDDPTREAAALALGVELEYHAELWQQIQDRFARFERQPTENNKRQAFIPAGAHWIENPVGTAPAFIGETEKNAIICLPGVPREMEHLMEHAVIPYLKQRFQLQGMIVSRILRTAGLGESALDELIGDLETLTNPTVGLSAHAGSVDVRITTKADSREEAIGLIEPVEAELRRRLGEWIYGADHDTLADAALARLDALGWSLAIVEAGLEGRLIHKLADPRHPAFKGGEVLPVDADPEQLMELCRSIRKTRKAHIGIGIALLPGKETQRLRVTISSPLKEATADYSYGGPPKMAPQWAANIVLNLIRRLEGE